MRGDAGSLVWWRADHAPARWTAGRPEVARAVHWREVRRGIETGRLDLSGDGVAWRISVVLARLDAAELRVELQTAPGRDVLPAWTIADAPGAVLAVNAGQFQGAAPWGWLVHAGTELQPPGRGPLSSVLVIRRSGAIELLDASEIAEARATGDVLEAFQSYPSILVGNGEVPAPLRRPGRGVDLTHRDSRLAACTLRDGRLLLALTRFMAPESPLARLPFGPTAPEMAAIMGALGCRRAVLLDGGLSGQMALRESGGRLLSWPGLRAVPLGLVAYPAR
ncbi:MAG TPA: phosphodiester glycosidase family protein [Gemmatimonadaceae bacterium]|nr:phosphodiester glycosidase family protein [Gemmatimonadaceae bacterium]